MSDPIRGVKRRLSQGLVEVGRRAAYRPETFCFVSGSYRSGTTAVADWLARQDDAAGFSESRLTMAAHAMLQQVQRFKKLAADGDAITGELRRMLLGYYLKKSGGRRPRLLIDKEPLGPIGLPDRNYGEFLGNVRRLFPGVKLIMMSRDPVATLWSMTRRDYGHSLVAGPIRSYTLDEHIDNWCATARVIVEFAGRDDVYVCRFERLTADPAGESDRIGRFLGVEGLKPFEPRPTKDPAFDTAELRRIGERTGDVWRELTTLDEGAGR